MHFPWPPPDSKASCTYHPSSIQCPYKRKLHMSLVRQVFRTLVIFESESEHSTPDWSPPKCGPTESFRSGTLPSCAYIMKNMSKHRTAERQSRFSGLLHCAATDSHFRDGARLDPSPEDAIECLAAGCHVHARPPLLSDSLMQEGNTVQKLLAELRQRCITGLRLSGLAPRPSHAFFDSPPPSGSSHCRCFRPTSLLPS